MDLLKEDGFSIIEALVGIVLLGIITVFTIIIFNNIWSNPGLSFKKEAFYLADKEIENSINQHSSTDTSYYNQNNSLFIERKVESDMTLDLITVSVVHSATKKEIVSLSVMLRK